MCGEVSREDRGSSASPLPPHNPRPPQGYTIVGAKRVVSFASGTGKQRLAALLMQSSSL